MKNEAYDDLIAAGIEVGSHESDLYCPDSLVARKILDAHGCKYTKFRGAIDRQIWLDVPFQFMPYWRNRAKVQS